MKLKLLTKTIDYIVANAVKYQQFEIIITEGLEIIKQQNINSNNYKIRRNTYTRGISEIPVSVENLKIASELSLSTGFSTEDLINIAIIEYFFNKHD